MKQPIKAEQYKYLLIFSLWILHGIIELGRVFAYSDGPLSTLQSVVAAIPALWVVICLFAIVMIVRGMSQFDWDVAVERTALRQGLLISAGAVLTFSAFVWVTYGFSSATPESLLDNVIRIFLPLLNLATWVALEIILIILITIRHSLPGIDSKLLTKLAAVLSILVAFWAVVLSTGLGIVPAYVGDWSRGVPAVPLFEWHIFLACLLLAAMAALTANDRLAGYKYFDLIACILIWAATVLVWNSQPVIPNDSMLEPHEPNFEIYPFIDAQMYDQYAQWALVGKGFGNDIPPRPLYISFLAIAHALVGQDYQVVVRFQSLALAFFPMLLYVLGAKLFGRHVGFSIAALAVLRDFTSNLVSPLAGNLSYSKALLSEIPTAIFLILFVVVGIRWIREEFPLFTAFTMGGILGIAMLIRTQVIVAFPVIIIFALLAHPKKAALIFKSAAVLTLAMAIGITPWLWRNWQLTGRLIFDSPEYQSANLALRYNRLNGVEPDILRRPDETYTEYNKRLTNMAITAIQTDPAKAVWGISNMFLNHAVNNILIFPLRYELNNLRDYWIPSNAFWEVWDGKPTLQQSLLLGLYTFLFGSGVAAAWHRNGWLGLLPLALNFAYNLWTSLALLSGQRFMLSMDWSIYFYYMVGISALFGGCVSILGSHYGAAASQLQGRSGAVPIPRKSPASPAPYLLAGVFILLIGSLPPLMEHLFPERYPFRPDAGVLSGLTDSPSLQSSGIDSACLQKLGQKNVLSYVQGRALYPRYYVAGDGERITDAFGYRVSDENRRVFEFVGQENGRVVLHLRDYPDFFPHASDVTLIYGKDDNPWFVFVENESQSRFYVMGDFDRSLCE